MFKSKSPVAPAKQQVSRKAEEGNYDDIGDNYDDDDDGVYV